MLKAGDLFALNDGVIFYELETPSPVLYVKRYNTGEGAKADIVVQNVVTSVLGRFGLDEIPDAELEHKRYDILRSNQCLWISHSLRLHLKMMEQDTRRSIAAINN